MVGSTSILFPDGGNVAAHELTQYLGSGPVVLQSSFGKLGAQLWLDANGHLRFFGHGDLVVNRLQQIQPMMKSQDCIYIVDTNSYTTAKSRLKQ